MPKTVKLLSGGNPQIAKGDGAAPVKAYLSAMPGWKKKVGIQLDRIIMKAAPKANKAVRWNSPFYGMEGLGWFLSFHCYTRFIKVAFFNGISLKPLPPGESKHGTVRYLDVYEKEPLDEKQFAKWVKQASKIQGWNVG